MNRINGYSPLRNRVRPPSARKYPSELRHDLGPGSISFCPMKPEAWDDEPGTGRLRRYASRRGVGRYPRRSGGVAEPGAETATPEARLSALGPAAGGQRDKGRRPARWRDEGSMA